MSQTERSEDFWRIPKRWPKRLFWGTLLFALAWFISSPFICDYTDRARVSELIVLTQEAREKVEELLLANSTKSVSLSATALIPSAISTKSKKGEPVEIAYREISERGEIKVFSPQLGVFLLFTPAVKDKKVSWSCWGSPKTILPASCRGDS